MNNTGLKVAVVGATGAVGSAMIEILAERNFPVRELVPLASQNSIDKTISFHGKEIAVQDIADYNFEDIDLALFAAGNDVSAQYAPMAVEAGALVVDNSSQFRYDPDIPLIIPEVNLDALQQYDSPRLIANPNCSTIQLLVALKPIYEAYGITRIDIATYQSVSGAGSPAIEELLNQITELLNGREAIVKALPKQIAFNVVPHIDAFQDNGFTREEMKMLWETQKILNDPDIAVNATAVRVPVIYGHSEAVTIETKMAAEVDDIRKLLSEAPGVIVMDELQKSIYPTALQDATGQDAVYVGRIRSDLFDPLRLNMWIVSDNIRKGAATNAIQIAEAILL